MKTVLVAGAGRGQVGLYKAAREMGVRSIAASIRGDYPGFELADEIDYIDITDVEAVLEAAKKHRADAIVTACVDITVPSVGYTCDALGLRGLSYEAAKTCTNKLAMKKAFEENGVRAARYVRCDKDNAADIASACSHLDYPLITKPVDLCGSRGINIVKDPAELAEAVRMTISDSAEDYCIVEEYIDGYEFSATAFVSDGEILFELPTGDVRYGENDEIPAGHYLPFEADDDVLKDTDAQMRAGIRALGLDNCAVNADLMLMDGRVYILEMTGRLGANCIPELTSIYMGYDINRMIIENALGINDHAEKIKPETIPGRPCYAQMIVSDESGVIKSIHVPDEVSDEADILFYSKTGDKVNRFSCTNDCVGQIVTQGDSLEEAKEKALDALKKIRIVLE